MLQLQYKIGFAMLLVGQTNSGLAQNECWYLINKCIYFLNKSISILCIQICIQYSSVAPSSDKNGGLIPTDSLFKNWRKYLNGYTAKGACKTVQHIYYTNLFFILLQSIYNYLIKFTVHKYLYNIEYNILF